MFFFLFEMHDFKDVLMLLDSPHKKNLLSFFNSVPGLLSAIR